MAVAKKPVAKKEAPKAAAKVEEPVVEPEAPAEEECGPQVSTLLSLDGLRAFDTIDGAPQDGRDSTLAEQLWHASPLILEQAVGIVHGAVSGSVVCDGCSVTITLVAR